jgi:hypothetical protein
MLGKEQLSGAMTKECDVAVHLFGKLPPDSFEYRPTPKQRSTTELLRYLSLCGIAGIQAMDQNNFALFQQIIDRNKDMKPDAFPAEMQKQKTEIENYFAGIDEKKLETQMTSLPGVGNVPLQVALLNGPLKWLTGYKLQLFTYAKAAGNESIGTANAWAGIDWPPKKEG